MNLFLDTSSLVKLYHTESGTDESDNIFLTNQINNIFLSEISKLEFISAVWKKVRTKEILKSKAIEILKLFEDDYNKYYFIPTDTKILESAKSLINKHGLQGLRSLDAVQLATAVSLINQVDLFQTADKLLQALYEAENLPTKI